MSFSDISQISDISGISRISRANCSRIMGKLDSLQNLSGQQYSLIHNASKIGINQNQESSHLQKAAKCLTLCEESIGDHIKSKVILKCIQDATTNTKETLSKDVVSKLKGLLLMHEVDKYMHLPCTSKKKQEKLTVLGITDLPEYDLRYEEKLDIKCSIEALLREKIHDFILSYESLGGNMKEVMRTNDCNMHKKLFKPYEVEMLQWKDKIEELCEQYTADVAKCRILFNNWNSLRYKDVNRIYFEKAEYMLLQAEVAEVQAKITKLSCLIRMYKETPKTIDAYKTLNAIVDEKLFATMSKIEEKENLKKQYKSLENTEYNNILKTYLQFCKAIEKKKQILEKL